MLTEYVAGKRKVSRNRRCSIVKLIKRDRRLFREQYAARYQEPFPGHSKG
ncbi:MAG: hypothetical protein ACLTBV_14295 [Enterocloster bolteae]